MAEPLSWLVTLTDQLSAPANAMAASLKKLSGGLDKVSEAHAKGGKEHESFRHQLFEATNLAKEYGEAILGVGETIYELGAEIVKAAAEAEKLDLQFELAMGNKDEAKALLEGIEKVGGATYMTTQNLQKMELQLVRAGFRGKELEMAAAAAQDIGALTGGTAGSASAAAEMLASIRTRGGVKSEKQLVEIAKSVGMTTAELEEAIGKQFHVGSKAVKDLVKEGKVGSTQLQQVLYDALVTKGGGAGLGALAARMGKTVDAQLTKVREIPERLFEGLRETKGYAIFSGFLQNILDLVSPSSPFGAKLFKDVGDLMDRVFTALFGDVSGAEGKKKMEALFTGVLEFLNTLPARIETAVIVLKVLWDVVLGVAAVFDALGTFIGETVAGIVLEFQGLMEFGEAVGGLFATVTNTIDEFGQMIYDKALNIGIAIVNGIKNGISKGVDAVKGAMGAVADAAVGTVTEIFSIHSPSRVMQDLGRNVVAGFTKGIDDHQMNVAAAMGAMQPGQGAALAGNSVSINGITITVNVDGHGHDADELASKIADAIPPQIHHYFESIAMQQGAI